jgi:hypothetical protein
MIIGKFTASENGKIEGFIQTLACFLLPCPCQSVWGQRREPAKRFRVASLLQPQGNTRQTGNCQRLDSETTASDRGPSTQ